MSVEMLAMISRILYASGGVLFGVALILFFCLKIYKIVGDLSGTNAQKEIEAIGKRQRAFVNNSQRFFIMEEKIEDKLEIEQAVLETGLLGESGLLNRGDFFLIQEMGFLGSSEWIE